MKPSTLDRWLAETTAPGDRLTAFQSWLFGQLATRLQWPCNGPERDRQIAQCARCVHHFVQDCRVRGWLFSPKDLADVITARIDEIRRAQAAGRVDNLYPFFQQIWKRYSGERAEELRARAMAAGTHIDAIMRDLRSRETSTSFHELLADDVVETARESRLRAAEKLRKKAAASAAEKAQLRFFR